MADIDQSKFIDPLKDESLVRQFTRLLMDDVARGRWELGEKLPTEMEFSYLYSPDPDTPALSRVSVRKGLMAAEADGWILGRGGIGWFRSKKPFKAEK